MSEFSCFLRIVILVTCSFGLTGCGGDGKYPVSGVVTWEGESIPADHNGFVTLTPVDTSLAPDAGPIEDGKFKFTASPGEKKVEILISRPVGKVIEAMGMAAQEQYVPSKYNEETELSVVVGKGPNEFQFDLSDE